MLDWLNRMILAAADPALNWLLDLPMDLTLLIVAVATGSIITFSRLLTTNQDLLRRCSQDKRRLKVLIREAKARQDKDAVARHRATLHAVGMITLRQEGRPLLTALLPIAVLGTWGFQRLAYFPPRAGEPITVQAHFPVSAAGELAHIVPQQGLRVIDPRGAPVEGGWIREIVAERAPGSDVATGAVATWRLQADASPVPYMLAIRHQADSVEKDLLVGQTRYAPELRFYESTRSIRCVQIGMQPVKWLGRVPGLPPLHMPPWMVAYFLIAIPSVSLIKRVAKIY